MSNITKTGIFQSGLFQEYHIEPDGSKWSLVFVHNNPAINKFDSTDPFTTGFYKNKDLYFNFNTCNSLSSWEFLVIQADTIAATPQKRRWVQTKNPLTATFADVAAANITKITTAGYSTDAWGGLYPINNSNTYLCVNNGTNGNWWGATGSKIFYQGGIPAWFGKIVTDGYVLIYVRVDWEDTRLHKIDIAEGREIYEY